MFMIFLNKVKPFLIFIAFFLVFITTHLYINVNKFTTLDDPYYHAKHSFLLSESGQLNLVRPWLEFHFLQYAEGFHCGSGFLKSELVWKFEVPLRVVSMVPAQAPIQ